MAAGSTYTPIAAVTASGGSNTQLVMSSIPSTYTDLVLVVSGSLNAANNFLLQLNGDTAANYSYTYLFGDGSAASSSRGSNTTTSVLNYVGTGQSTTIINIMNYANSTTYKTTISRGSDAAVGTMASVVLWRSTAAITSITLKAGNTSTFNAGSTFTLYGIQAA
jgi:hypothetical protein